MKKRILPGLLLLLCLPLSACAHKHVMQEEVLTEKTCTADGVIRHFCTECDYSYEETVPSDGHDFIEDSSLSKEATCTQDGTYVYQCRVCGETRTERLQATGHDFDDGTVSREATCTQDGECVYQCRICGETKTERLQAAHDLDEGTVLSEATCTRTGTIEYHCRICGETIIKETETTPHEFVNNKCIYCLARKLDDYSADTWVAYRGYLHGNRFILETQNAVIDDPDIIDADGCITYYPVCKKCHVIPGFYR